MTPAVKVAKILKDNINALNSVDKSNVFALYIPQNVKIKDGVIIVVTELPSQGNEYGNGIPVYSSNRVQLEFYYPKNYKQDMSELEKAVKQLLLKNNIFCYQDVGHAITPDTQNIMNTLKCNYKTEEF